MSKKDKKNKNNQYGLDHYKRDYKEDFVEHEGQKSLDDYNYDDYGNYDNQDNFDSYDNLNDYGNFYNSDDSGRDDSDFAQKMYEDYVEQHDKETAKSNYISFIMAFTVVVVLSIGCFVIEIRINNFNDKFAFYNELNDSYNEFVKYQYVDLERTKKTSYPSLIESFPETKNYEKFCLPCSSIHNDIEGIFKNKFIKRKIESIKNIPLSETTLYVELSEKVSDLIDNYKKPVYTPASEILKNPSITDIEKTLNIFRSWLWASLYYSLQNNSKVALLLAYAPILACQDIEANSADGAAINTDIIDVQIDACKQLLYLANYTDIDIETSRKISKNFINVINAEPSFTRKVDNYIRCDNNFYQFLVNKNNAFAKYVSNSKEFKELSKLLFDGAKQQIIDIENTGDYSKFYNWQNDFNNKLQKVRSYPKDSDELFKQQEMIMVQKAFENSFVNYFNYYCLNLEKLAIMNGTAIALAFKALDSEDKNHRRRINEFILNKWLGISIPKDPLSRKSYSFVGYQGYSLVGSPVKNDHYKGQYIKGKYLPLLLKRRNF